ncbi:hypothetical protein [Pseudomarimonas arenosa]|uniref:Pentapeptide MXKDX repeat protein n=1 Tax=Pseudomarimonas arenosa TaxID=2774145 RepID=A0AAW3ZT06_9GAMM|nr:hypothetical protein [Pseudomarimonas arenosa]MBD8527654.1 hypothetical protein [Pseudomarimonas arenosa]
MMSTTRFLIVSLASACLLLAAGPAEAGKDKKKDDQAAMMAGMQTGGGQSGQQGSQDKQSDQKSDQVDLKRKPKKCKDGRGKTAEC